ncbi:amidase [Demequina capsici]|uniref:Amidase family protein n=1 Tax=Demequina capsici TaxID=3075620 RepID=A0AA96F5E2_9MICO|nr:amidase family protein [Demequina sp. OYTSA14]WNM24082.1 amidase family protein [Demequina sp. OYTSA14]
MTGFRELELAEYQALSGVELGRMVAAREVSPVHLAESALELAARDEADLNAYVELRRDAALAEASQLEAEARDGRVRSALHGVPIASKDNMPIIGEPCLKGSRTSAAKPSTYAAPMVERLQAAGAVIIGRTTTPEFGWKGTGISPLTGVTRNPWDTSRNSGGSSAGSGSTVGAGAVPIATGSDAGGSIRIPAAFSGAVGLKPTLSAIPVWPGTANESLSHAGPITRSVADARAVLEITAGPDPRDPQSFFATPAARTLTGHLRIGVVRAPFGIAPSSEVSERLEPTLSALRGWTAQGTLVEDVDVATAVPREVFERLWVSGRGLTFAELIEDRGDAMDPGLARLLPLAREYDVADYLEGLQLRRAFNAEMFALLERYDALIMPTMPLVAFDADQEVPAGGEADAKLPWITWTPYTYPFNITGQPAVTVPVDLGPGRLPVGLQVVGGWARDLLVLDVAERLELLTAPTLERTVARPA